MSKRRAKMARINGRVRREEAGEETHRFTVNGGARGQSHQNSKPARRGRARLTDEEINRLAAQAERIEAEEAAKAGKPHIWLNRRTTPPT